MNVLIAIPVFNEEKYLARVLSQVLTYNPRVLVVDDGSTDATPAILRQMPRIQVLRHPENAGYGQSIIDALRFGQHNGYDWVITMDCDEQHEPAMIPSFLRRIRRSGADIISGSRYLAPRSFAGSAAPADRRTINQLMTQTINKHLGLSLTDSFCGFKAHRVEAMKKVPLSELGYAFPMQLWVRAVAAGLSISELPVKLIYNDPTRHFGGELDDPNHRLRHYLEVFFRELCAVRSAEPAGQTAFACCA